MDDPFQHHLRLKMPCGNCPFLKKGAIELRPGRLEGIIAELLASDMNSFSCHKTLSPQSLDCDDDDDSCDRYTPSAAESLCAGAAAYLMKKGRPSISMRVAFHGGLAKPTDWDAAQKLIID